MPDPTVLLCGRVITRRMSGADANPSAVLLKRARDGSREALGALFDACGGRVLALIRLRLGPGLRRELESRDLLQSTFVKALERLDQFDGGDTRALTGWLAAIARNELRDRARFHGRQRRDAGARASLDSQLAVAETLSSRIAKLERQADVARLEAALAQLSADHREVILLRQYEELGFREIGERLGRSEEAARMLHARALAALTIRMKQLKG